MFGWWGILIFLALVVFIIISAIGNGNQKDNQKPITKDNHFISNKTLKDIGDIPKRTPRQAGKPQTNTPRVYKNGTPYRSQQNNHPSNKGEYDSDIIDITPPNPNIKGSNIGDGKQFVVPYWPHQYVYSYSEINHASYEQRRFYFHFKEKFLNGECLDLNENTNYAFILLFDLLNDYNRREDIEKLETLLKTLGLHYPKTKSYGMRFLIERMNKIGLHDDASRITDEEYNYWKLGIKYRDKLNMTPNQSKLLNNINYSANNFNRIDFCAKEIVKLYLSLIDELKIKYIQEGTTLDVEFESVAVLIAKQKYDYPKNLNTTKRYLVDGTICELHSNIFKYCENAVREFYGHKRKISIDVGYKVKTKKLYETKIISTVRELLPRLVLKTAPPNKATEIELNTLNTSRWKTRFETLTKNYADNPKGFVDDIISLGNLNKNNPSIELIFFEASKFIARYDNVSALSLYMHYLHHDLKSSTFDNRQLTKTVQKSLFKNNEQLRDFEEIVSELLQNGDLKKALRDVSQIYAPKRKKIQLDTNSVEKVQQQHSGTVELLNEYLQDEYEDGNGTIKTREINSDEIEMEITRKTTNATSAISPYISSISFLPEHISVLTLFAKNNLSIQQGEIEILAKSKGLFKNQIIESINDVCFEVLDDNLIEEEDSEYYTINYEYYQTILSK
jgi:hypothetical protein